MLASTYPEQRPHFAVHKYQHLQNLPKLYFSQRTLDFGGVKVGQAHTMGLEVENISETRVQFRISHGGKRQDAFNQSQYYYFDGKSTVKSVKSDEYITVWSGTYNDLKILDPGQSILIFVTLCVGKETAGRLHTRRLSNQVRFSLSLIHI